MPSRDVILVDAVRTPIGRGKPGGALSQIHPVDLLARTLDALINRVGLDKAEVEDVVAGCVTPLGEQGACIGRLAALKAGFPISTPGYQLNRFCGSSQQAIHSASQAIAAGDMDIVIACGVESMSRVPMGSDYQFDEAFRAGFPYELVHQGQSAEMLVDKWNLSRQELDDFAARSHQLAALAEASGQTAAERFKMAELALDEGVRVQLDRARMGTLPTVFKQNGCVTAGNSSQISDGAAAVLLMSREKAAALGLRMRARILTRVAVGTDPVLMLTGPIDATKKALARAGLNAMDIGAYEINEAFASVVLGWRKEIGAPIEKVNRQGGAIAHGHPLGATGAVLMTKLVNILESTGERYGLQAMCIGYGMGTATIIERQG